MPETIEFTRQELYSLLAAAEIMSAKRQLEHNQEAVQAYAGLGRKIYQLLIKMDEEKEEPQTGGSGVPGSVKMPQES